LNDKQWVMAFGADGTKAVIGNTAGHVEILDVATGHVRQTLPGLSRAALTSAGHHAVHSPATLSRDGKLLVTSVWVGMSIAAEVQVWDLVSGREIRKLEGIKAGMIIPLSPDGTILAAPSQDASGTGLVTLWDVASGKPVRTLGPHNRPFLNMAFSPDGRRLVVAAGDDPDHQPDLPGELMLW